MHPDLANPEADRRAPRGQRTQAQFKARPSLDQGVGAPTACGRRDARATAIGGAARDGRGRVGGARRAHARGGPGEGEARPEDEEVKWRGSDGAQRKERRNGRSSAGIPARGGERKG